ncbi:MAG TPA: MDR family MFS transporter [Bacillota bacterium]|nr:MDR family MFS transporter [Bacillota bacterium]
MQPIYTEGQSPLQSLSQKEKLWIYTGILFGILLGALDQTVVGTSMPKVIASLGGMKMYTWVFTAYMLASTASAPIFGKLSDMYGRRPFYLAGMLLFMVGSILCGLSRNMTELILFRGLQGLSAGSMVAIAYALVADLFEFRERSKYQGYVGAVFGISSVVGPVLGGIITDLLNWRYVFFANIPVGIIALTILRLKMPKISSRTRESVDYSGVFALLAAAVPMLLAFSLVGHEFSWGSLPNLALLTASALAWVGFFFIEKRTKHPFIPLDLFASRTFSMANLAAAIVSAGMFGVVVFMPLFLQVGAGLSTTVSGMLLTPMMLIQIISSVFAGVIIAKTGRFKALIVSAVAVMAVSMFLVSGIHQQTPQGLIVLYLLLFGFGLGVTFPVFNILTQAVVPPRRLGVATAALQFFRNIGSVIGVSIYGAILNAQIHAEIMNKIPAQVSHRQLVMLSDPRALANPKTLSTLVQHLPNLSWKMIETLIESLRHAVAMGIGRIFLTASLALLLAVPAVWLMAEIRTGRK